MHAPRHTFPVRLLTASLLAAVFLFFSRPCGPSPNSPDMERGFDHEALIKELKETYVQSRV